MQIPHVHYFAKRSSSESIPVWESHIDNQGELFYVEFSSNLQVPTTTTDTVPRQPCSEDRQEVLKKKKKKKSKLERSHLWCPRRFNIFLFYLCCVTTGRLSRLLKRRAVGNNSNNKDGVSGNEMAHCESPGVYLPTEAKRSPADDWSDWTSFTLELEVHPTTGADGSSLRYPLPLPSLSDLSFDIDTIRFSFCNLSS